MNKLRAAVLLCVMCAPFQGSAALVNLKRTPYDRQLERVQHVLVKNACENNGNPGDIGSINQAMREAYQLPYSNFKLWQSPEETLKNKRADCKGRAVLLHHKLNQAGVGAHRLVIGRVNGGSSESHTWLVWKIREAEYLLDPTFYKKAIPIEKISKGKYIPEYIYCGGGKYGYVPNSFIFEGLDDIPDLIKDRSQKTRIFLVDEKEEDSDSPPFTRKKENTNPSVKKAKRLPVERSEEVVSSDPSLVAL